MFGVCTLRKPYAIVMEFYGVDGKCVTIQKAAQHNLLGQQETWAGTLQQCCEAVNHLHSQGYVHGDLKGDNILFHHTDNHYHPVIIDFGKMAKMECMTKYKLSSSAQHKYRRYYPHIAPEVVRGTHPKSPKSDIYSLGMVFSLICHHSVFEQLKQVAAKCIHEFPEERPDLERVITDLSHISLGDGYF